MSSATTADHDDHGHEDHGHGDGHGHGHKDLAHHFDSLDQQFDSAKLGMWTFLVTEVLMFGGLFAAFILFQSFDKQVFIEAHHHLDKIMGGVNTVVLLTSSLTAVLAVRAAQLGQRKMVNMYLLATIVCAGIFLVVKYFEYSHKIHDGLLPGDHFTYAGLPKRAHVFFSLYFMMTGLHGFHVVLGMCLMTWILIRNNRGDFSPEFYTPVEMVALYWHLVDLIWIYLFPLLYLVG